MGLGKIGHGCELCHHGNEPSKLPMGVADRVASGRIFLGCTGRASTCPDTAQMPNSNHQPDYRCHPPDTHSGTNRPCHKPFPPTKTNPSTSKPTSSFARFTRALPPVVLPRQKATRFESYLSR